MRGGILSQLVRLKANVARAVLEVIRDVLLPRHAVKVKRQRPVKTKNTDGWHTASHHNVARTLNKGHESKCGRQVL